MRVRLERYASLPFGTFGRLILGEHAWFTVEPPWRNNRRNVSCIPPGVYPLRKAIHHISTPDPNDDYEVYEIAEVENRTAIHIHIANVPADVIGCVGPGTIKPEIRAGELGVWNSRIAFDEFMMAMNDEEGEIEVVYVSPYEWR
jgi:hypothetical protein